MAGVLAVRGRSEVDRRGSQFVGDDASQRSAMSQSRASTIAANDGTAAIAGDLTILQAVVVTGHQRQQKVYQPFGINRLSKPFQRHAQTWFTYEPLFQNGIDIVDHALCIVFDFLADESNDFDPLRIEPCRSFSILSRSFRSEVG
jgi:hypothetical protein